ncbi:pyridoxal phosphate-dependent transferase [Geopyxis carbonaria]|nr:pyridoxal phosphate-dependent transferase [Geopyxis carbonaria]
MSAFNLDTCARPNILALVPYRCARDDYKDNGTNILLDANENAYGPSIPLAELPPADYLRTLHRYPDPHQVDLKQRFCDFRNVAAPGPVVPPKPLSPENLFLGVGSDEAIDALLRAFCVPGRDRILTCPPTYGMYSVSACVNDVAITKVDLDVSAPDHSFPVRVAAVSAALAADPSIKVVYLCSPGNPTGSLVAPDAVFELLHHPTWNGIVVVDEAYIDFAAPGSSLAPWVTAFPNLVVMQTLSKAFGLAGIRLGAAFTAPPIARLLNSLKAPYSISTPTSHLASLALQRGPAGGLALYTAHVAALTTERERLVRELPKLPRVGRFLGGFEANFLLVEILDESGGPSNGAAEKVYAQLAETQGVVVRFRGREAGCEGCLRITVGTERENRVLLQRLGGLLA